jgi:hypothetical protein
LWKALDSGADIEVMQKATTGDHRWMLKRELQYQMELSIHGFPREKLRFCVGSA